MTIYDDFLIDVLDEIAITKIDKNKQMNKEKIKSIILNLDKLLKNYNETTFRDIRAAFKAIEDYIYISVYENNDNLLSQSEECLMKYTGLNPELNTSEVDNKDLIAYAYFGLSIINSIRGKFSTSLRYIIRMFESSPSVARNELASDIFDDYFSPLIVEVFKIQSKCITDNQKQNISDIFETQVIIHKETFEQNIDQNCISIAKIALENF